MIPLFTKCPACNHPAIRAARQCKTAMALFNDGKSAEAETLLKEAMGALRNAKLPMMQAKILNSLGLIYAQRNETPKARRCMSSSLRIIAGHVGTDNWLYSRITANRDRLAA